jgi:hypothetical protein
MDLRVEPHIFQADSLLSDPPHTRRTDDKSSAWKVDAGTILELIGADDVALTKTYDANAKCCHGRGSKNPIEFPDTLELAQPCSG